MRHLATIAGILLGCLFLFASGAYFFELMDAPPPPEGSPIALFMGALAPTGYLTFIKAFELIGALLVMLPATRRIGLLVLGPIIVTIHPGRQPDT